MEFLTKFKILSKKTSVPANTVILASYPKSGSTWLANLLLFYFNPKPWLFEDYPKSIQEWYGPRTLKSLKFITLVKTHQCFDSNFPQKPVIYIVRDPRNVLLSYYYGLKNHNKIDANMNLDDFLDRFLDNGLNDNFGSWEKNVLSYSKSKNTFLVTYEDLQSNTLNIFRNLISFLQNDFNPVLAEEVINFCSRDSMRKDQLRRTNKNTYFTSSKDREWSSQLNQFQVDRINNHLYSQLKSFKYIN